MARINNSISRIAAFALIMLAIWSCGISDAEQAEFVVIPDAEWCYGDTLTFDMSDSARVQPQELKLYLRHTPAYAYANLWLEVSYQANDTLAVDTFNVEIADRDGRWLGKKTATSVLLCDTLRLREVPDSTAKFHLRHIMRAEKVDEIEQIGVAPIQNQP